MSLRSVHYDRERWSDPEVFKPERFLSASGEFTQDEGLCPFGIGKVHLLSSTIFLIRLQTIKVYNWLVRIFQVRDVAPARYWRKVSYSWPSQLCSKSTISRSPEIKSLRPKSQKLVSFLRRNRTAFR
jgi:hypothetical protein